MIIVVIMIILVVTIIVSIIVMVCFVDLGIPVSTWTRRGQLSKAHSEKDPPTGAVRSQSRRWQCGRGGTANFSTETFPYREPPGERVREYGVRAPVFYGNLREQTGENGFPRKPTGNLFCYCRNLRKSLEASGNLWENVI